ncbi:prepilin peptidase [Actinomyces vulturis]|uniref:prepilin peptidase n=1 Tax=Actinomyces vulturis TaxID=1857645 RepID=UPI00082951C6|nr:A24 family peptidase [Actinomyces vulturis]
MHPIAFALASCCGLALCVVLVAKALGNRHETYVRHLPAGSIVEDEWLLAPKVRIITTFILCGLMIAWMVACGMAYPHTATLQTATAGFAQHRPGVGVIGATLAGIRMIADLLVMTYLVAASGVDLVCHRLPNRTLAIAAMAALIGALASGTISGFVSSLIGGLGLGLLGLLLRFIAGGGLGMGDIKMLGVIGLWLGRSGLMAPAWALTISFLIAGPIVIIALAAKKLSLHDMVAMGPFLTIGAFLAWAAAAATLA